jgi:hypothetical protein
VQQRPLPGGYGKACNQGKIHDPLKARAVVLDDGSRRTALVALDTAAVPAHLVQAVRAEIPQAGVLPEPPRKAPFKRAWDYGSVPPEKSDGRPAAVSSEDVGCLVFAQGGLLR